MSGAAVRRTDEPGLAIRAAWLHFGAGLTQAEVAARLGLSAAKAHRLIAFASQSGAVTVTIDGDVGACVALEERLIARFGLESCVVVPDLYEPGLPLRALGLAGAAFLGREIDARPAGIIGIGHGRTLAAMVAASPRREAPDLRFVSLLGGLTRNYAANPHDVMHRLAEKTGAAAYVMPVPFLANSPADREVFLAQRGVGEVAALAARADLLIVGVGTSDPATQLVAARMIDPAEIAEVEASGGVGEMLGHFFDAAGRPVETSLSARTLSPDLAMLAGRRIVAVAGGTGKRAALAAVLASGLVRGLVTDEPTAAALADAAG